jgi:hypothetical protein
MVLGGVRYIRMSFFFFLGGEDIFRIGRKLVGVTTSKKSLTPTSAARPKRGDGSFETVK